LEKVGISKDSQNHLPFELSGGMQKRVALARAMVMKPEVLFFDEPTTGLDPMMGCVINNLIAITITHDMNSLAHIAHTIALLYQGKLIWQGTKQDFFQTPDPYVTQFRNGQIMRPFSG
jgi:phospholipid/cholesterol/gamma-HCH transport system ATP-binding protein